jgi:hypothetical protein
MDDYTIRPARYAKGKVAICCKSNGSGWKTRAMLLAERLANGRYSGREKAYILSPSAASRFERLYAEGWSASNFSNALYPPKA